MPLPEPSIDQYWTQEERKTQSVETVSNWIWNSEEHLNEIREIEVDSIRLPLEFDKDRRWSGRLCALVGKAINEIEAAGDFVACGSPELIHFDILNYYEWSAK